jgi:hypothetical protein
MGRLKAAPATADVGPASAGPLYALFAATNAMVEQTISKASAP